MRKSRHWLRVEERHGLLLFEVCASHSSEADDEVATAYYSICLHETADPESDITASVDVTRDDFVLMLDMVRRGNAGRGGEMP